MLEANSVIHGIMNPPLAPYVTLHCLDRHMAKRNLDLLELAPA